MITETRSFIKSSDTAKLRVGVLCIDVDPGALPTLEVMVAETPGAYVVDNVDPRIVAREVTRILEGFQYQVCIIDFDKGVAACCRIVEHLRDNCDNRISLIAASSDSSVEILMAAMRSGCSEFLPKPFDSDRVSNALAHITARRHVKEEKAGIGQVVTLIGAKGGTGVTSLTLHLALNLVQRHNQKCVLVDQHPALGDVSLYLGLTRHRYSFYELVHNTDRLDEELLQGFVLTHESGLHVLDSPEVIDQFPHSTPEAIEHTLSFLAVNYKYVLIDCPPGMTQESGAAIRQSDRVVIVITPELPAVRNAVRTVEYLLEMHYPDNCIDILLNRHAKNNLLAEEEIESALRRPIAVKIPNSYEEFAKAINAGTPLLSGRNAKLSLAFDDWADRLMGKETTTVAKTDEPRTWLQRLGIF
jgi:pilus assembly protein CpaE